MLSTYWAWGVFYKGAYTGEAYWEAYIGVAYLEACWEAYYGESLLPSSYWGWLAGLEILSALISSSLDLVTLSSGGSDSFIAETFSVLFSFFLD